MGDDDERAVCGQDGDRVTALVWLQPDRAPRAHADRLPPWVVVRS